MHAHRAHRHTPKYTQMLRRAYTHLANIIHWPNVPDSGNVTNKKSRKSARTLSRFHTLTCSGRDTCCVCMYLYYYTLYALVTHDGNDERRPAIWHPAKTVQLRCRHSVPYSHSHFDWDCDFDPIPVQHHCIHSSHLFTYSIFQFIVG